jgi:hypothetical protein
MLVIVITSGDNFSALHIDAEQKCVHKEVEVDRNKN